MTTYSSCSYLLYRNSYSPVFNDILCPELPASDYLATHHIPDKFLASFRQWVASGSAERGMKLLVEKTYDFQNYGEEVISIPVNWSLGQPGRDNLSWQLHSLPFLRDLICAHSSTNDARALELALHILSDWYKKNTDHSLFFAFAWNDHSTALRLVNISNFFLYLLRHGVAPSELELIASIADRHMRVLASDSFYVKGTNHGLDQSFALYRSSYVFDFLCFAGEARSTSLGRLSYELNKSFSTEHIHIENSPEYHAVILSSTLQINSFVEAVEGRSLLGSTSEFIEGALEFLARCIKPDGRLVPVGDTIDAPPRSKFEWLSSYKNYKAYIYALTEGREGEPFKSSCKAYGLTGYAFIRKSIGALPARQDFYAAFKCGFLSHYHRQDDDNNLYLFAFGEEWLADGGLYKHDHSDPQREYIRSRFAHNVVAPVGVPAERRHCPSPPPAFSEYIVDGEMLRVTGSTGMYRGFQWDRTLVYESKLQIEVFDSISSLSSSVVDEDPLYEQYWQFPSDKTVSVKDNMILATSRVSGVELRITIRSNELEQVALLEEGGLRCKSKSYGKLEPVIVACARFRRGKSVSAHADLRFTSPLPE